MKIEYIHVRGYRSLYDVELTPRALTVLVGPNNAGKSNVLDAIDFIADVHRHGVEVALIRKGGYENVAHRRMRRTKRPIEFVVKASLGREEVAGARRRHLSRSKQQEQLFDADAISDRDVVVEHAFSLKAATQRMDTDFFISEERLRIEFTRAPKRGSSETRSLEIVRSGGDITFSRSEDRDQALKHVDLYPLIDSDFQTFASRSLTPTSLLTGLTGYNDIGARFETGLATTKLYQLSPYECRRPGVSTPNADIEAHGANLPALAEHISRRYPDSWQRVIRSMQRIVPGLENIRTNFTHDRRLTLEFVEAGVGRPWTSEDVSDGTIQSLAMFTALFDPRSSMALVEEPENAVHPWIVRSFVDACREAASKQIMVTTHSPVLINYLKPDDVFVVSRANGRTEVTPLVQLDPDAGPGWEAGDLSIFDLLDSGLVQEAVPGGFRFEA